MSETAVTVVRFVKPWEIYFAGDDAAFPLAIARRLVRAGIAIYAASAASEPR